jgi:hypothetical protein
MESVVTVSGMFRRDGIEDSQIITFSIASPSKTKHSHCYADPPEMLREPQIWYYEIKIRTTTSNPAIAEPGLSGFSF